MKHTVEMGSGAHDIHTKLHKDLLRHSKLNKGDSQTKRQHGDRISLLSSFQIKGSRLERKPSLPILLPH
jgi:hypothetical protein